MMCKYPAATVAPFSLLAPLVSMLTSGAHTG